MFMYIYMNLTVQLRAVATSFEAVRLIGGARAHFFFETLYQKNMTTGDFYYN